jgi:hypothetical protein
MSWRKSMELEKGSEKNTLRTFALKADKIAMKLKLHTEDLHNCSYSSPSIIR